MKIALQQVQENISNIANRHEYSADIVYELLAAYGRSKSAITQLREGHLNKADDPSAVLQKDVVYFKAFTMGTPLEAKVEELYEDPLTQRYNPRYLIATDLKNLAAKDNLKGTTLTIKLDEIEDDSVNWITRQQMEGQTVFNIDQNYFIWKITESPMKYKEINFD